MKVFCLVSMIIILISCVEEESIALEDVFVKNPSFKIDGNYDVFQFNSEKAVDLNLDGKFSFDVLAETDEWSNSDRYFLQFITEPMTYGEVNPSLFIPKIFLWVPFPGIISETDAGNYLYTTYSFANLLARCKYLEKENLIQIKNGNLGEGQIISAFVLDDVIRVKFIQSYYTSNGWEKLTINAAYKRRK